MGMYTELVLRCQIKKDAPQYVHNTLYAMCSFSEKDKFPEETRDILKGRIPSMFFMSSFYHHPFSYRGYKEEGSARNHYLFVRCDLKNYENEIETFIEWLTPFIYAWEGDFLGYKRYEEDDAPTILYYPNTWRKAKHDDAG